MGVGGVIPGRVPHEGQVHELGPRVVGVGVIAKKSPMAIFPAARVIREISPCRRAGSGHCRSFLLFSRPGPAPAGNKTGPGYPGRVGDPTFENLPVREIADARHVAEAASRGHFRIGVNRPSLPGFEPQEQGGREGAVQLIVSFKLVVGERIFRCKPGMVLRQYCGLEMDVPKLGSERFNRIISAQGRGRRKDKKEETKPLSHKRSLLLGS